MLLFQYYTLLRYSGTQRLYIWPLPLSHFCFPFFLQLLFEKESLVCYPLATSLLFSIPDVVWLVQPSLRPLSSLFIIAILPHKSPSFRFTASKARSRALANPHSSSIIQSTQNKQICLPPAPPSQSSLSASPPLSSRPSGHHSLSSPPCCRAHP